jgi:NAD(P)-dependent dehydrogenase (short-subunit alcohol dehydrogenase family)
VHQVTNAFLPLLRQGQKKTVANMYAPPFLHSYTLNKESGLINRSTSLGSISLSQQSHSMPGPAYKITKAALNMLTAQYAHTYGKEGFVIFALSPGVRPSPFNFVYDCYI